MATKLRRLFFALWPEQSARPGATAAISLLAPKLAARWIRPANLHITLAFLGDVETERLGAAQAAADAVDSSSFELCLDTLEHWRKPQVLCLTPSTLPPNLERLAADLGRQLKAAGFALEQRPYRPHLTLARKATHLPADACLVQPILWKSTGFVLVESRQDGRGSSYGILKTWPLSSAPLRVSHPDS